MPTVAAGTQTGLVSGLDVMTRPGPIRCTAFIGPNHQVETELDVAAAALGHATRSGREVEVEFLPGPPHTIYRIQPVPVPITSPLPPLPDNDNGGLVEELTTQNAGHSTYTSASIALTSGTVNVVTAIPMLEVALQAAARNGIRVEIEYVAGRTNVLTRVRLLDR